MMKRIFILLRKHRGGTISIILRTLLEYLYYILFRQHSFKLEIKKYHYFYHLYNTTYNNERAVEIPIILDYVKNNLNKNILEIGNVLNHYFKFSHDVVDKYEKYPGVIRKDILTYQTKKKYRLIVSISTIEHIGWDESLYTKLKDKNGVNKTFMALKNLVNLLDSNGKLVVTFPCGYNDYLDKLVYENKFFSKICLLQKISDDNQWKQIKINRASSIRYNYPYLGTNGLIIAELNKKHSLLK